MWLCSRQAEHLVLGSQYGAWELGVSLSGSPLWTRRFAFGSGHEGRHQLEWISAKGAGNGNKFHDIQPAFAALIFGDKRLRFFQAQGEGMLGEPGGLARLDHKLAKDGLVGRMDGFIDTAAARCHQPGKLIPSSDYPKRG
jgi:hypothetical protein